MKIYVKIFMGWLWLFATKAWRRDWYVFDGSFYDGKKIILIGPAESSLYYMEGQDIDSFEVIIRINNSPNSLEGKKDRLGSRTDVLYHCFDENPILGGGRIDESALINQSNKFVLYTYDVPELEKNFYGMVLKNKNLNIGRVPRIYYHNLKAIYSARMPTTGLQAINHVMSSNFRELHITGFTFFKTNYADGYRDEYKTATASAALAKSSGNHDPDEELKTFVELLDSCNKESKIFIDKALREIICQYKRSS